MSCVNHKLATAKPGGCELLPPYPALCVGRGYLDASPVPVLAGVLRGWAAGQAGVGTFSTMNNSFHFGGGVSAGSTSRAPVGPRSPPPWSAMKRKSSEERGEAGTPQEQTRTLGRLQ